MFDRIVRWWRRRSEDDAADADATDGRIDSMVAARGYDHLEGGTEGGSLPPGYLPTGVDEGRPKT
jgi:hypothetical protein